MSEPLHPRMKPKPTRPKNFAEPTRAMPGADFAAKVAEVAKHKFLTNDLLQIIIGKKRPRVFVNGIALHLKLQAVGVLFLLVKAALRAPGLTIETKELVQIIESFGMPRGISWVLPNCDQVRNAIYQVRRELKFHGLNCHLVESLDAGYRLSTPSSNIRIIGDGGEIFRWEGSSTKGFGGDDVTIPEWTG